MSEDLLPTRRYNRPDKCGHFAAWEQPAEFSAELRAAFGSLRQKT
jgi:pimeloyl-ACP methyl ester carboxylesterase